MKKPFPLLGRVFKLMVLGSLRWDQLGDDKKNHGKNDSNDSSGRNMKFASGH